MQFYMKHVSHVTADNSTLRIAYRFIQSLTTVSGSRLFGSVVEHWIIDPAARFRFPPKSWDFFQPNSLCFVLCYGFHVVRWGLVRNLTYFYAELMAFKMTSLKRGSVTADNSTLRIAYRFIFNL